MTTTKKLLIAALPRRLKMPLRYWYRMAAGRLDPELAIVLKLVSPEATCVDVGANNGLYSYALARHGARVHAYEPQPSCASVIRAFRSPRITVHEFALSDHHGSQVLYVPIKNGEEDSGEAALAKPSGEFDRVEVKLETLDDQGLHAVSFIKIDVEGHELSVIAGARSIIDRDRPLIVSEIEQRHLSFPMTCVFDSLIQRGYTGFFLWHDALHPLADFSRESHQNPQRRLSAPHEYVNNFIFVHRDDARRQSLERVMKRG